MPDHCEKDNIYLQITDCQNYRTKQDNEVIYVWQKSVKTIVINLFLQNDCVKLFPFFLNYCLFFKNKLKKS